MLAMKIGQGQLPSYEPNSSTSPYRASAPTNPPMKTAAHSTAK